MHFIKIILLCFLILANVNTSYSQTVDVLVKKGIDFENQLNEVQAYKTYQEVLRIQPQHLFALVRCSELASRIGKMQQTVSLQEKYYKDAIVYAQKAIKIKPDDSDANLVLSVAYGRLSLLKRGSEKVTYVRDIKSYAEKSLRHNPENFKSLHVLGKWHYEVSNLNVIETTAVRFFYGGFPPASLDSSIYFYEKAMKLAPGFALNYLELAKAKKRKGERHAAILLLKKIYSLPPSSSEDPLIRKEANWLILNWKD